MLHTLKYALQVTQPQLLRESLQQLPFFSQFISIYSYEQLRSLKKFFQLLKIQQFQVIEFSAGSIYHMMDNNTKLTFQYTKQKLMRSFTGKNRKRKSSQIKLYNMNSMQLKLDQQLGIDYIFDTDEKVFGMGYTAHGCQSNILVLNFLDLHKQYEILANKFKIYWADKLKFLHKSDLLKEIPKPIFNDNLTKFTQIKLYFQQTIYDKFTRSNQIFFLYKGQVEIKNYNNIQNKNIILQSCQEYPQKFCCYLFKDNMLHGLPQKSLTNTIQKASCKSNQCILFTIDRQVLGHIIEKSVSSSIASIGIKENNYGISIKNQKQPSINKKKHGQTLSAQLIQKNEKNQQICNTICLRNQNIPRCRMSRHINNDCKVSSPKRQRLRQYFSDSLNKKFEQFAQIKMKQVDENAQHPVLFQMKTPKCQPPSYHNLNQKLKSIRIRKIAQQKQTKLQKSDNLIINLAKQIYTPHKNQLYQNINLLKKDKLQERIQKSLNRKIKLKIQRLMF